MLFFPLLMGAIMGTISYFIERDVQSNQEAPIGLIAPADVKQTFKEAHLPHDLHYYENESEAMDSLAREGIEGYLVVEEGQESVASFYRLKESKNIQLDHIQEVLNQHGHIQRYAEVAQVDPDLLKDVQVSPVNIASVDLVRDEQGNLVQETTDNGREFFRLAIAMITTIGGFIFVSHYCSLIAQEVASEKGMRIMEILLSSMSARTHFLGKIVGILLAIFTQVIVYLVIVAVFNQLLPLDSLLSSVIGQSLNWTDLLSDSRGLIIGVLIFFGIGIFTYTNLAALLGSLVTRVEDLQKSLTPLVLFSLVSFYIGLFSLQNVNSSLVGIASFVPGVSPFVMAYRMADETVSLPHVLISMDLGAIALM